MRSLTTKYLGIWLVLGLFGIYGVTAVSGCLHPPATIVTPAGQAAYAADQVVARLTEFSNLVQADTGTAPGNISFVDAFTIIEWVSGDDNAIPPSTGVVQIVQTTAGQGWKAAALKSWTTRIKPILQKYTALAAWVDVIDSLLQVVS